MHGRFSVRQQRCFAAIILGCAIDAPSAVPAHDACAVVVLSIKTLHAASNTCAACAVSEAAEMVRPHAAAWTISSSHLSVKLLQGCCFSAQVEYVTSSRRRLSDNSSHQQTRRCDGMAVQHGELSKYNDLMGDAVSICGCRLRSFD